MKKLIILIFVLLFMAGCGKEIQKQKDYILKICNLIEETENITTNFTEYEWINEIKIGEYEIDQKLLKTIAEEKNKTIVCGFYCGNILRSDVWNGRISSSGEYSKTYENCLIKKFEYKPLLEGRRCNPENHYLKIKAWYLPDEIYSKEVFCCVDIYCTNMGTINYKKWYDCNCEKV